MYDVLRYYGIMCTLWYLCRSQSQCNVTIDEPSPGAKERIITIVGTPANIAVAEQLMKDR